MLGAPRAGASFASVVHAVSAHGGQAVCAILLVAALANVIATTRARHAPRYVGSRRPKPAPGAIQERVSGAGLAILCAAGFLVASAAASDDARCADAIWRAEQWRVIPDDAMYPGASTSAASVSPCRARVSVSVVRGRAEAGALVVMRGSGGRTAGGARITEARVKQIAKPTWLATWRLRSAARIDSAFAGDAPLVRALVLADERDVDAAVRSRFAAAGIGHMLSVSGLHVAIVALAVQLALGAARIPKRAALIGAIIATAAYVIAIGAPPAAVRAGTMLAVVASSQLLQRPISPWTSLALGAFAPLVDPRAVLAAGYQLSVAGIAALIASGRLARLLPRKWRGWKRVLARDLLTSAVATCVTAPLVAWSFGQLSLIAPLTNLLAAPIIGVLQPLLFVALVAPTARLARWLALAAHPLLAMFDGVARLGAAIPYGSVQVAPSPFTACASAIVAIAAIVACVSRFPRRPALVACGAASLAVAAPVFSFAPTFSGETELHMLDVGQGDAILLRTPRGHWIVFDAGRAWRGGDAGKSIVVPYIRHRGGDVLAFVLSHPHMDHAGGAAAVIEQLHPHEYWDAAFAGGSESYLASLQAVRDRGVRWRRVHPFDSIAVDGVIVRFLGPDSAFTVHLADPNSASTIALIEVGAVRFLLVGDAEAAEEDWLLAHEADSLHADVLKVGHHGSNTSTTPPFLAAVHPRVALVSVGAHNSYGHPSASVIAELARSGVRVLRTDRVGTIVVRTDGKHLTVDSDGHSWTSSDTSAQADSSGP